MAALLLKFPGFLRTAASVVASLAAVAQVVPALAPYQQILITISGLLGGAGVARASARVAVK